MIREGHDGTVFFTGTEVEHTPALGKQTLFVVGDGGTSVVQVSKTGQLIEKVELINESGVVTSNYPNGKIAIQFTFNKGNKEGNFIINSELGKPEYTSFYKNDLLNNDRIEYYSNGNIYLKEHFVDNDYEGIQEYFKEDGKPWIKAEYKNDELHGKTQIYTNGIITTTKKYDSDSLVEISK
jgi:antitoxin component YwqK of YwqJK toxin-antitoxin module